MFYPHRYHILVELVTVERWAVIRYDLGGDSVTGKDRVKPRDDTLSRN